MKRYFYKASPAIRNWLQNQYLVTLQEQMYFRSAMLALVHNAPGKHSLPDLYQSLMDLSIKQQFSIAQANHIQQAFFMLNALYKTCTHNRVRPVQLAAQTQSNSTEIMDPDKFVISDLRDRGFRKWTTGWKYVQEQVQERVGFKLSVKSSSLQHMWAGKGVFMEMHPKHVATNSTVKMGSLLGFVPGISFEKQKTYDKYLQSKKKGFDFKDYLRLCNGSVLEFSNIVIHPSTDTLPPEYLNPYALGQFVNHPPPHTPANVCFQLMTLPTAIFPDSHLHLLPYANTPQGLYQSPLYGEDVRTGVGIFALRDIKDKQQLFVDYFQQHNLQKKQTPKNSEDQFVFPEWLLQPPPCSPFLQKNEYEHVPSLFWRIMEQLAMKQNKEQYEKFKQHVKYEPDRMMYQHNFKKYQQLVKVKYGSK